MRRFGALFDGGLNNGETIVELPVIWNTTTLKWRHLNKSYTILL